MDNFSNHPLLQSRPKFLTSLNKFIIFLLITIDDLKAKYQTLKAQKKILRQNKTAKGYLSCQIYMLKKHIQRLDNFNTEIERRLHSILNKGQENSIEAKVEDDDGGKQKGTSWENGDCSEIMPNEVFREAAIDCGTLEDNQPSRSSTLPPVSYNGSGEDLDCTLSSESAIDDSLKYRKISKTSSIASSYNESHSNCCNKDSNADVSESHEHTDGVQYESIEGDESIISEDKNTDILNITTNSNSSQEPNVTSDLSVDKQLLQLSGDLKKMERRCKHILDVTDKYCVLNNETDLKLDLQKEEVADLNTSLSQSPTISPWATRCSSACSTPVTTPYFTSPDKTFMSEDEVDGIKTDDASASSLQLPASINDKGLLRMTIESFGDHLAVLMKTYTRRHSHKSPSYSANKVGLSVL